MVKNDPKTGEEVSTIAHFRSKTHKLIGIDDTEESLDIMKEKMLKSFSEYQKRGSGRSVRMVDLFEIRIGEFRPLRGKGHMPLPKPIEKKKAIINMKNTDDECFKWAVTRALNLINIHPKRISKELEEQSKELNWEGTEFPTPLNNIKKFEENNNIGVNVFRADESLKEGLQDKPRTGSNVVLHSTRIRLGRCAEADGSGIGAYLRSGYVPIH
ncbi:Hypothetical predicted protein [Paramuricea clavata]|uniref:Uncharacterized protein n=1 Tax=Paramuricea clavata TaxID=317549 RepID=A0A6S7G7C5_PARCT|nr:Hypothetical predicted protein [Paramuricea clavata]